eukprot:PhF_6_TR915/c0_g1_i1/m.1526
MTTNYEIQVESFGLSLVQRLSSLNVLHKAMEVYNPQGATIKEFIPAVLRALHTDRLCTPTVSSLSLRKSSFLSDQEEEEDLALWEYDLREKWEAACAEHNNNNDNKNEDGIIDFFSLQTDLVVLEYCILSLFRSVDRERRGVVTWSDLIEYLVDGASRAGVVSSNSSIQEYTRSLEQFCMNLNRVKKMVFMPSKNRYTCICRGRTGNDVIRTLGINFNIEHTHDYNAEWGRPEMIEAIDKYEAIAAVFADGYVRVFDAGHTLRVVYNDARRHTISVIRWIHKRNVLACGTRCGNITLIDPSGAARHIDNNSIVNAPVIAEHRGPEDLVSDILDVLVGAQIVSCGLDGVISVYNEETRDHRKLNAHSAGVSSMSFATNYNLLISCGVENAPLCWTLNVRDPVPIAFVDTSKPHTAPLVKVYCVPNTPQVLSMDRKGVVKVWDLRNYMCVQTIAMDPDPSSDALRGNTTHWFDFVYNNNSRTFYSVSKRVIHGFEYNVAERSWEQCGASESSVSDTVYVRRTKTYITASRRELKIWDATSGKPVESHFVGTSDVTAICLDEEERRVLLGTHAGEVIAFDLSSGHELFRELVFKNADVTGIAVSTRHNLVVATGAGTAAYLIWKDSIVNYDVVMLSLLKKRVPVSCVSIHHTLGVVLFGEEPNRVTIWSPVVNHGDCTRISICKNDPFEETEVRALIALDTMGAFLCGDSQGFLHLWSLGDVRWVHAYMCIARWKHTCADSRASITCVAFCPRNRYVYVAEDTGFVVMYALEHAIAHNLKSEKNTGKRSLVPPLLYRIRAHPLEITSLTIIDNPSFLMTSSTDSHVNFFSLSLKFLCRLCRDPFSQHFGYNIDFKPTGKHSIDKYNDCIIPPDDEADEDPLMMSTRTVVGVVPTSPTFLTAVDGLWMGSSGADVNKAFRRGETSKPTNIQTTTTLGEIMMAQEETEHRHTTTRSPKRKIAKEPKWRPTSKTPNPYDFDELPEELQELVLADSVEYMMFLKEAARLARTALRSRSVSPRLSDSSFRATLPPPPPSLDHRQQRTVGDKQDRSVGGKNTANGGGVLHKLPPVSYRIKSIITQETQPMHHPPAQSQLQKFPLNDEERRSKAWQQRVVARSMEVTVEQLRERRQREYRVRRGGEWRGMSLPPVFIPIGKLVSNVKK